MPQNYGLGRGLASLIPQKKRQDNNDESNTYPDQKSGQVYNLTDLEKMKKGNNQKNNQMDNKGNNGKEVNNSNSQDVKSNNSVQEIAVEKIIPNSHQPRAYFDEKKLEELANSIKNYGIIQPIVVTPQKDKDNKNKNGFEIVAGERRFQAAQKAGLKTVPIIVRDTSEKDKLELAILENVQRHDLNSIEEAKAYKKLITEFKMKQEEVAEKLGKSRSVVANKIRLLDLSIEIQKALIENKISEGHAKVILAVSGEEKQRALFNLIIKNKLTVRQVENKVQEIEVKKHIRKVNVDPEVKELEEKLMQALGTKVKVAKSRQGGRILIDYYSREELDNILNKIST